MSGGSFNYLYCKEPEELFNSIGLLVDMEDALLALGCDDIARDARELIEDIKKAETAIRAKQERLNPVFRAVEHYYSGDIGKDGLKQALEQYRTREGNK